MFLSLYYLQRPSLLSLLSLYELIKMSHYGKSHLRFKYSIKVCLSPLRRDMCGIDDMKILSVWFPIKLIARNFSRRGCLLLSVWLEISASLTSDKCAPWNQIDPPDFFILPFYRKARKNVHERKSFPLAQLHRLIIPPSSQQKSFEKRFVLEIKLKRIK